MEAPARGIRMARSAMRIAILVLAVAMASVAPLAMLTAATEAGDVAAVAQEATSDAEAGWVTPAMREVVRAAAGRVMPLPRRERRRRSTALATRFLAASSETLRAAPTSAMLFC